MNSGQTERSLNEVEQLLRQGLHRIASTTESELGQAQDPLQEALRLTEVQTLNTLSAVETAQAALRQIRNAHNTFIDTPLGEIDQALQQIVASQQGQDLAGQRLKKAIILLGAVEDRIHAILRELGVDGRATAAPATEPPPDVDQSQVDALLAELGI